MLRTRNVLRRVCIPAQLQSLFGDDLCAAWDTSWALHHKAAAAALRDGAACSSTASQRSSCSARGYSAEAWRSSRVSGAASFPYGRAAEMRASQAARGPERGADEAGTRAEDEEDEDVDARTENTRRRILEAALRHVSERGWSVAALQAGARELGLSAAAAALVPGGEAGLVQFFVEQCNSRLAGELAARRAELAAMRVPDRIRTAVRRRLEMLVPVIDTWPQALAIQARPANMPAAARALAGLADDVWHAAGDTSADYNWYTKRALLAGVIGATELFMITDYSPGYADTWAALDRRLADVSQLGKAAAQARGVAGRLAAGLESLVNAMVERLQRPPGPGTDKL